MSSSESVDIDDSSDASYVEVPEEDNSSEEDEEVVVARQKLRTHSRGWRGVALLRGSDSDADKRRNIPEAEDTANDEGGDEGLQIPTAEDTANSEGGDEGLHIPTAEDTANGEGGDEGLHIPSEYFDSSDPGSYRDSTDEDPDLTEDGKRKKSRFPMYVKQKGIPNFELSMLFNTNSEFKEAVTNYAILTRHDIRFTKNEPGRCRAKCMGTADCPWLIFASLNREINSFQVKTFSSEHTCEPKRGLKRLTTSYLYKKFYNFIATYPDIKLRHLKPYMQEALELDVSLGQCKRVRKSVLADLAGSCVKEYKLLRSYAEEILVSNPGSTVKILSVRENEYDQPMFKGFYCCFKSCKEGVLSGCRPVLGIDGCFLKGLVQGELLTAIGRDGNNQMFPVAWAVVLVENTETWSWFLDLLSHDLKTCDGEGWTLISDRQKGLVAAVGNVWPRAEHRFCARHYYANWCKLYSGRHLKTLFWSVAKSTNKAEFDMNYKELERVHAAAAKDLISVDPRFWCKAFFKTTSKCDSVDNNLCEAFNGTILEARSKSIISMLEDIRRAVMRRIRDKKVGVNTWKNDYGPLIHKKIVNNVRESHMWECEWNGGGSYEVKCGRNQYVVKLREGICSCGAWELSGIPCMHAVRAIHDSGGKPEDYIDLWYKTHTYLRAYQMPIEPIRGENMWPRTENDDLLPPKLRNMPGRPKKKRKREHHETILKTKMTREGKTMTCRICKGKGHNSRNMNCPGKSVPNNTSTTTSDVTATLSLVARREPTQTSQTSVALSPGRRFPKKRAVRPKSLLLDSRKGREHQQPTSSGVDPKYVSPYHAECRPKSKPYKRTQLHGLGLYINPETGRSILNPGTSIARVVDCGTTNKNKHSQDGQSGQQD